jgi:hypothetical protein
MFNTGLTATYVDFGDGYLLMEVVWLFMFQ